PGIVQVDAADIRGDVSADKAVVADASAQFARSRIGVLHRQHRPSTEAGSIRRDRCGETVIENGRGLDCERAIKMVVDERRRQRQDGTLDAVAPHPLDLLVEFEERRVQTEMHATDIEVNRNTFASLDLDGKFRPCAREPEELIRHVMTVNVGNHDQSPRYAVLSRSSLRSAVPWPFITMRPFSST